MQETLYTQAVLWPCFHNKREHNRISRMRKLRAVDTDKLLVLHRHHRSLESAKIYDIFLHAFAVAIPVRFKL